MEIITAEEAMLMSKPEGTDEALELIMNAIKKKLSTLEASIFLQLVFQKK